MAWWPIVAEIGGSLLSSYLSNKNKEGGGDGDYDKFMAQDLANYQEHEAQGRGDIMGGYNTGMSYLQPYMQAGNTGLSDYMTSLGNGTGQPGVVGAPQGAGMAQQSITDKFKASPGYQFALQQGLQSVSNQGAAQGLAGSGGQLKALDQYSQGLANQEYGNYQNRLSGLASMGQQTSGQAFQGSMATGQSLANLGLNYAKDEGDIYSGVGANSANEGNAANLSQQNTFLFCNITKL